MKDWRWKYRQGGKEKRQPLGTFPRVGLAEDRSLRDAARRQLVRPAPIRARPASSPRLGQSSASEITFEAAARRWWADWSANKSPCHVTYVLKRLEADAFPAIGVLEVAEVKATGRASGPVLLCP